MQDSVRADRKIYSYVTYKSYCVERIIFYSPNTSYLGSCGWNFTNNPFPMHEVNRTSHEHRIKLQNIFHARVLLNIRCLRFVSSNSWFEKNKNFKIENRQKPVIYTFVLYWFAIISIFIFILIHGCECLCSLWCRKLYTIRTTEFRSELDRLWRLNKYACLDFPR